MHGISRIHQHDKKATSVRTVGTGVFVMVVSYCSINHLLQLISEMKNGPKQS